MSTPKLHLDEPSMGLAIFIEGTISFKDIQKQGTVL